MDFTNIPTGLKITSQIPLDVKKYVKDESTLSNLGVDNNLAFTYHDQLEVLCLQEKRVYIWREVQPGEENTGLVPLDFIYPSNLPETYGIDYSNKKYNFFLLNNITLENLNENINISNVGNGSKLYKGYNSTTNTHEFKTLESNNLTIIETENKVIIETPSTASIPGLYVNNLYVPTYQEWLAENSAQNGGTPVVGFQFIGRGTLSAPFTDTIVYTLNAPLTPPIVTPNTAIQNALDGDTIYSYVGAGTRLNPNKEGQQVIIQNNNTSYTFTGNFEYSSLNLVVDGFVNCTTTGYLIDMDNFANIRNINSISIDIKNNRFLSINSGQGFKNNGTTTMSNNYISYRQLVLIGEGTIIFNGNDINKYLLNSDKDSNGNSTTGFNNDGAWQFEVRCRLDSEFQGLVAIGGISQVFCFNATFTTGTVFTNVDVNLKAFNLKGGRLRLLDNTEVIFYGSTTTNRLKGFTLEATNGFTPILESNGTYIRGNLLTLISKENTNNATLLFADSGSPLDLFVTNVFDSPNLWQVNFKNNSVASGTIDFTKVDLTFGNTISTTNTIGNNLIETLVVYNNRANALSAGVPLYSAFISRDNDGVAEGSELNPYPNTNKWKRDIVLPS